MAETDLAVGGIGGSKEADFAVVAEVVLVLMPALFGIDDVSTGFCVNVVVIVCSEDEAETLPMVLFGNEPGRTVLAALYKCLL